MMKERTKILIIALTFIAAYYVPWANETIRQSGLEAFMMLQEYAREHVLLCLVPAFFIAGAIAVFISGASVIKYLGPAAKKWLSYSVASVSGSILAVCSCTVLPLFAGIYTRGGGHRPSGDISLLRPGHQRVGHNPDGQGLGAQKGIYPHLCPPVFQKSGI